MDSLGFFAFCAGLTLFLSMAASSTPDAGGVDLEADAANNYGAIGAVIGNEISHSFDASDSARIRIR